MKLKSLAAALILAAAPALAASPPIPLFSGPWDPANTGANVNFLITEINAILTPALLAPSGAVNLISLSGGLTGSPAIIGLQPGADANAGIQINPNGSGNIILFGNGNTGVLQFGNSTSFVPVKGMGACPGVALGAAQPFGVHANIQGYIPMQDWLGRNRYAPVC